MARVVERIPDLEVRNVTVAGTLTVAGQVIEPGGPSIVGGKSMITGSGQLSTGLTTITSVTATLGQTPTLDAAIVSATWSGSNVILRVSKPTATDDATPIPATVPALVNWQATGS